MSGDDRCGPDLTSAAEFTQSFPSLPVTYSPNSGEELLEVTIEYPSGVLLNIDSVTDLEITSCSASGTGSRSRSLGWSASSSRRIPERQLVENAKQFSRDLKRKLQRISRRDGSYSSRSAPETTVVPRGGQIPHPVTLCRSLTQRFTRSDRNTERAIHGLRFISSKENGIAGWREVQNKFATLSKDGHLSKCDFAHCIGMGNGNSKEFAEELFDALCRRRRIMVDKISVQELYEFWYQITDESFDARLQIFFNMMNKNGDGRITENEVKEIIILSASANNLSRLRERAEEYAALIMEELAPDGHHSQFIELKELEMLLLQKDISHSYSQPFSQTSRALSQNLKDSKWGYKRKDAFHVMGYCLVVAKGAAETLKFNMALILLPVCRITITYLRSTELSYSVPFDDSINFHKTISIAIIIGGVVHASSHLACDFPRIVTSSEADYKRYLVHYFGVTRPTYFDLVKDPVGITGFIMVIFMKWYRKNIWMYLAVPVLLYSGERILRFFRSRLYSVEIGKVVIYPGNVVVLHMSKPTSFDYKSGQYVFVQCPAVSKFEWHPFSITSSPRDDYLSIHIRQRGDWTEGIKKVFSGVCEAPDPGKSGLLRADGPNRTSLPELLIDGPYGAPAQDHQKNKLFSCLNSEARNRTPANQRRTSNTKNAYFYWVTREQGSFDWFREIMNEIADSDRKGIIEMHNYLTSVYEEGDARSTLLTMIQTLNHAKNGVDIFSGTKVRTHFGRPKWKKVLSKISSKHKNARIGVFYCGGSSLGKELSTLCHEFNQTGSSRFEFHKEQF
ncbi:hypothetical protein AALP_AA6G173900 [Arabis alpina]|uniref:Uncharacterized protein n=1 Tax=Arabis alpina TaxID=50452 RepID=A0A087GPV0_ARAAL|nr:hypothetical protein AALP_AA6G173900 [Arabis alpina]